MHPIPKLTIEPQKTANKLKPNYLPVWNPYKKGYQQNPIPFLEGIRKKNPLHKGLHGHWMAFRYDDVKSILVSDKFRTVDIIHRIKDKESYLAEGESFNSLIETLDKWLLFLNPPDHLQVRKQISNYWNGYKLGDFIESEIDSLFREIENASEIDFIEGFAERIPIKVMCQILGLPPEDFPQLRKWSSVLSRISEPFSDLKKLGLLEKSAYEFNSYLKNHLNQKRGKQQADLMTQLLSAEENGQKVFTDKDILSICQLLFFAGVETSIYFIGQMMYCLVSNPESYNWLLQNPNAISSSTEELLRYTNPLQFTVRQVLENSEIDGKQIKKDEWIYACLASANFDDTHFENPTQLQLDRKPNRHIAFGYSMHHCLGAKLARDEGNLFLKALTKAQFNFELANPITWEDSVMMRGIKKLPLKIVLK